MCILYNYNVLFRASFLPPTRWLRFRETLLSILLLLVWHLS